MDLFPLFTAAVSLAAPAGAALLSWRLLRRQYRKDREEWQTETGSLRDEVIELSRQWEQGRQAASAPPPPAPGFNLNRRPKALRRLRNGHEAESVAGGTGWSVPEVLLLRKIEEIASEPNRD